MTSIPATSDCGPVVTTLSPHREILLTVPTNPSVYQTSRPEMAIPNGAMTLLLRTFDCGPWWSSEEWADALGAVTAMSAVAAVHAATAAVMDRMVIVMWCPLVVLESERSPALSRRPNDVVGPTVGNGCGLRHTF